VTVNLEEELQEKIKGDACEWLLEDMLPTTIAESEAFRKFLKRVISTTGSKVSEESNIYDWWQQGNKANE
jgi:hypothetical protein